MKYHLQKKLSLTSVSFISLKPKDLVSKENVPLQPLTAGPLLLHHQWGQLNKDHCLADKPEEFSSSSNKLSMEDARNSTSLPIIPASENYETLKLSVAPATPSHPIIPASETYETLKLSVAAATPSHPIFPASETYETPNSMFEILCRHY